MVLAIEIDEAALRNELSQMDDIMPDVSNADLAETIIGLVRGTIQFKDVQGFTDAEMEALYTIAYNAVQAGAFDKAEKLFRFLALFDQSQVKYWKGLGLCLFTRGEYDAALQAYSMAAMLDIEDALAPMRLAECHLALGDVATAIGALEVALEIAGDRLEHADAKGRIQGLLDLLLKKGSAVAVGGSGR